MKSATDRLWTASAVLISAAALCFAFWVLLTYTAIDELSETGGDNGLSDYLLAVGFVGSSGYLVAALVAFGMAILIRAVVTLILAEGQT